MQAVVVSTFIIPPNNRLLVQRLHQLAQQLHQLVQQLHSPNNNCIQQQFTYSDNNFTNSPNNRLLVQQLVLTNNSRTRTTSPTRTTPCTHQHFTNLSNSSPTPNSFTDHFKDLSASNNINNASINFTDTPSTFSTVDFFVYPLEVKNDPKCGSFQIYYHFLGKLDFKSQNLSKSPGPGF